MTTFGVDVQYMLNFSSSANVFLGIGAGITKMRFAPANEPNSRTISDSYLSGDLGVNVHVTENVDLELGTRIMSLEATNTINNVTYTFDNLITGYVSIIYKFNMD